jgi:hypothetical protein
MGVARRERRRPRPHAPVAHFLNLNQIFAKDPWIANYVQAFFGDQPTLREAAMKKRKKREKDPDDAVDLDGMAERQEDELELEADEWRDLERPGHRHDGEHKDSSEP